jgi:hypothetical protein
MSPRWSQTFKPIRLKDGRTVKSLDDARTLILALPELHQRNPHWQYAGELVLSAAARKQRHATLNARDQLTRALHAEGLL